MTSVSPLIWILWPSSVFFAAVLSFRLGVWWKAIRTPERHEAEYMEWHPDEEERYADDEEWPQSPEPATAREQWTDNVDTEILPRIQDIRPPLRRTPIRRPPWVGQ